MEIEGFENYLIHREGTVENKKTRRFKKPCLCNGYYGVNVWNNGKVKRKSIHRLVAIHYIPNPDNLPCVDHIDRDKSNNDISNLRWCNHSQNSQNRCCQIDSKSQIKNIFYDKSQNRFQFKKIYKGERYYKYFKTLEEAIEYKENFLKNLDDVFIKS